MTKDEIFTARKNNMTKSKTYIATAPGATIKEQFVEEIATLKEEIATLKEEIATLKEDVEYWKNEYYYLEANPEEA